MGFLLAMIFFRKRGLGTSELEKPCPEYDQVNGDTLVEEPRSIFITQVETIRNNVDVAGF